MGDFPCVRRAGRQDASRLAEILIFTKRVHYRPIFQNDQVSFGEMQVLPLAQAYLSGEESLEHVWVYDDGLVKGMLHVQGGEVRELYVEPFFQHSGVGDALLRFAVERQGARRLWVLKKNRQAIGFYEAHGFALTGERIPEEGTPEFVVRMERTGT